MGLIAGEAEARAGEVGGEERSAGKMIDVNEYFRLNVKKHAAMAWRGYQSRGKGALVARIQVSGDDVNAAVIDQSLEYLSDTDPLIKRDSVVAEEVRIYNPETEIVVLVIWADGAVSIARTGQIPEHFFLASEH